MNIILPRHHLCTLFNQRGKYIHTLLSSVILTRLLKLKLHRMRTLIYIFHAGDFTSGWLPNWTRYQLSDYKANKI